MPHHLIWEKAQAAYERKQFSYAVLLLAQLRPDDPDFPKSRKLLRECQLEKFKHLSRKERILRRCQAAVIVVGAYLTTYKNLIQKMEWLEKALGYHPTHRYANLLLAQAAQKKGLVQLEILAYETLHQAYPKHVLYLRHLGKLYLAAQDAERAELTYKKWLELRPHTFEALCGLKNAVALHASLQGKWEKVSSLPTLSTDGLAYIK